MNSFDNINLNIDPKESNKMILLGNNISCIKSNY